MTQEKPTGQREEGVDVPFERLDPETLRRLVEEFVTREWSALGDVDCALEEEIGQVLQQLREKKVKVVFDLRTQTANIVPTHPFRP